MKITFTKSWIAFIFIIYLNNSATAGTQPGENSKALTLPVDSPKKEQAPPSQMLTFPVSSNTAKMTLNGYSGVRYQYYLDDKTPNSFDIRNARLALKGTVLRNLAYNFQCDFAPPTVRLMDATAAYTFNKYAKIAVGQQKYPLSYESLRLDYDVRSVNRSQAVEALTSRSKDVIATAFSTTAVNNNGRDIGVFFSGGIPNKKNESTWVDYYVAIVNGMGINRSDPDSHKDIAGRIVVHPIKYLGMGGSFYKGKATYGIDLTEPKDRNRIDFEISYEDGNRIYAVVEYLQGLDSTTRKGGYYGMLEGYILPKKFSALVKYDFYDPNKNKDDDATTITNFALNYYFASFTKIQLQYDLKHENTETQKKNDLISIQAQVFF
ncbi:MAG: OprO/OprP family phosphate-selective porin [Chitinophagales bacterium]|nr:OprO/OprP family phosphate-selective porin [Chitinophagales bacterium]